MDSPDKSITATFELLRQIDEIDRQISERCGLKQYTSYEGFSQEQLYELAGAKDCVVTMILRPESDAYKMYGESLTVNFVYTQKERLALEANRAVFKDITNIKAKELLPNIISPELQARLLKEGVPVTDIVKIYVGPAQEENNTFSSPELRTPKVLNIPFKADGDGKDIYWMFGVLCHFIEDGTALTPEEYSQYLAYKLILDPNGLTDKEKSEIYDDKNRIVNQEVCYFVLCWKSEAHRLTDKDKENLKQLTRNRMASKLATVDKALQDMGLSLTKFIKSYPDKASLLLDRVFSFNELRFNAGGKFLMYLSFDSFIHIYLRHVKELSVPNQFSERTKFQLDEQELMPTMRIVLGELNDDYQKYKENHPNGRFYRKGDKAFYYNGDYYDIDIRSDGQVATFYKRGPGNADNNQLSEDRLKSIYSYVQPR